MAITADANTAEAESEIQNLIKTRNMTINAKIVAKGGAGYGGVTGDPEAGTTVVAPTAVAPTAVGAAAQAVVVPVTFDLGKIPTGREIARLIGPIRLPFAVASGLRADERLSGTRNL